MFSLIRGLHKNLFGITHCKEFYHAGWKLLEITSNGFLKKFNMAAKLKICLGLSERTLCEMAKNVHFPKFSNPLFGLNYAPMAIAHVPKVY